MSTATSTSSKPGAAQDAPPSTGRRLLLLDGHSLAYRAFFALPAENFRTGTGLGLARQLLASMGEKQAPPATNGVVPPPVHGEPTS